MSALRRTRSCWASLTLLAVTAGLTAPAGAQGGFQKLVASDGVVGASFGAAIDVEGDLAVVGAPGLGEGRAFLFERRGDRWVERAALAGSALPPAARFGSRVAISGGTIAVGAPRHASSGAGSVVLFEWAAQGWSEVAQLQSPQPLAGDRFGSAFALEGDRLLVGSFHFSVPGVVYAFERSGGAWSLVQELRPSVPAAEQGFGAALALDGDRALIGAQRFDRAYVFERSASGWQETAVLTQSDHHDLDGFGRAVALDGDVAVVAAPRHGCMFSCNGHPLDDQAGTVYVFEKASSGWTETREMVGTGATLCRGLGYDVALQGDTVVAGAYEDEDCHVGHGTYLFRRAASGAWPALEDAYGPGLAKAGGLDEFDFYRGDLQDNAGYAVALEGPWLFQSAFWDSESAFHAGAVYVYDLRVPGALECCPQTGTRFCSPAVPGPEGDGARLWVKGSRRIEDDALFLYLNRVPAQSQGIFLMGDGRSTIVPPGSAGPLCIAGPSGVRRVSEWKHGAVMTCTVGTQHVPGLGTSFLPGSTWNFQAWYRSGTQQNTSDAVGVTFF